MRIAVICANGRSGRLIVEEAVNRGNDVTAFVRDENKTKAQHAVIKNVLEIKADDLKNFDVVIDAFGAWTADTLPIHSTLTKVLCDALANTNVRLLFVGGAGSLYLNPEHTMTLSDAPNFPDSYKPIANAMGKALKELRARNDVNWTYISPAADFQAEGKRTGKYVLAGEEFKTNSKGVSEISYADYAIAMVDEAMTGKNFKKRISVYSE